MPLVPHGTVDCGGFGRVSFPAEMIALLMSFLRLDTLMRLVLLGKGMRAYADLMPYVMLDSEETDDYLGLPMLMLQSALQRLPIQRALKVAGSWWAVATRPSTNDMPRLTTVDLEDCFTWPPMSTRITRLSIDYRSIVQVKLVDLLPRLKELTVKGCADWEALVLDGLPITKLTVIHGAPHWGPHHLPNVRHVFVVQSKNKAPWDAIEMGDCPKLEYISCSAERHGVPHHVIRLRP